MIYKETISLDEAATANLELGNTLIALAKNNLEEWYYRAKGENILLVDYNQEDIYLSARYSSRQRNLLMCVYMKVGLFYFFFFSLLHFICI